GVGVAVGCVRVVMVPVLAFAFAFAFVLDVVSLQAANAKAETRTATNSITFLLITPHLSGQKKRIASFTVSWRSRRQGLRPPRRSFALPFLLSPALDLLRALYGPLTRGHDRPSTYQVRFSPCPC